MRRHPLLQVVALTVAGTAVGSVVVLNLPWLPEEASSQAGGVDTLYKALAVASIFIFSAVMSILAVSVVRFRRRPGHEGDGEPIHGHAGLEVLWTAIPAIIVIAAATYSGVVLADIEKDKPGTQIVRVTAQQFAWSFDYRGLGVERAGELHLVQGQELRLQDQIDGRDPLVLGA
jgi:cytochrome c oxidase subunit 2